MKLFMLGFLSIALSVNLLSGKDRLSSKSLVPLFPVQIVTNPNEPPELPEGVYCSPKGNIAYGIQTTDHPCSCKNMFRDSDGDEDCCDVRVTNDPTCTQWCHEAHCACPKICIPGKPDETEPPTSQGQP